MVAPPVSACITFPILGFSVYLLICFAGIETADIPETSDLGSIYDGMCNTCAVINSQYNGTYTLPQS